MANVQPAAVAGMFYPADPLQLSAEIRSYVRQAQTDTNATAIPKALIAPHAGFVNADLS